MKPEIAIVVAMDEKRGIGKEGKLPWPRIPEDVQRFVDETMGYPVIMGRKTYESIPARFRPLSERKNIVVTRNQGLEFPGCSITHSIDEAIQIALVQNPARVCVIGGAEIYLAALPLVDTIYLTRIDGDFNADTFFPEYENQFPHQRNVRSSSHNGINYTFEDLTRNPQ